MRKFHRHTLAGASLLAVSFTVGSGTALAQFAGPTPLTLINGWTASPFGTSAPSVEQVLGIVQLRGAIATTGTNPDPFTLPAGLAPATDVYIPIDLCNATNGRLHITPAGVVDVETEGGVFSNAQCFTSLDGASYAPSATGFVALKLINGWTNGPFSTSNAAVKKINGNVHFKGAIATLGTNMAPFVLAAAYRPVATVYVPIDLCNATKGRLQIDPDGTVTVQIEGGTTSNAQCFTSLDGAWFRQGTSGYTTLPLINGWTSKPFGTGAAKAGNAYGVVYFQGAIATAGSNMVPFTLPVQFRPITEVYVPVDLCNATNGRLFIDPSGTVTVQAEGGTTSNAQCFTSLEGVSFVQ